jgi:hypothetical protein
VAEEAERNKRKEDVVRESWRDTFPQEARIEVFVDGKLVVKRGGK